MRVDNGKRVRRSSRDNSSTFASNKKTSRGLKDLLTAGIVVGVGLLSLLPICLFPTMAFISLFLAMGISIFGFVMGCIRASGEGRGVAFDYLEGLGPLRWVLALGFLGLYLLGYLLLWILAQILGAYSKPKLFLPWFGLQAFGPVLLVAAVAIGGASESFWQRRNPQQPPIGMQMPVNPGPAPMQLPPNPGPAPKQLPPVEELPPLVAITGDANLDRLLANLSSKKSETVRAAADALVKMQPNAQRPAVAKKIAQELQIAPPAHRNLLIQALGVWATTNEVPVLNQLLIDGDVGTRSEVLKVIGKLHDPRSVEPVVRCFLEFNTTYHGERALVELGPMAEKQVTALLTHPNLGVRQSTCRVLREIGTAYCIPALNKAKAEFEVRGVAEAAIAAIQMRAKAR